MRVLLDVVDKFIKEEVEYIIVDCIMGQFIYLLYEWNIIQLSRKE